MFIKNAINRLGYQSIMSVPKKWIYKLPGKRLKDKSNNIKGIIQYQKYSILVVEDMHLVSSKENSEFYRNDISYNSLDALARIFIECKLIDSLVIHNVPLTKKGKISFIDTEHVGKSLDIWLRISKFGKFLSPEKARYWKKIIQKGKRR